MAFRSATQLHTHSLKHSSTTLKPVYRCPHDSCTAVFHSLADFRNHVNKAHETVSETRSTGTTHKGHQCGICGDGEHFPDDAALFAHLNSATHLQKALQHVAEQNQSFLRPLETAAAIPDGCESPFKNQVYFCFIVIYFIFYLHLAPCHVGPKLSRTSRAFHI